MKTIGIIGGGQLGRMLAMAAARLNFRTVVLEPQPDCPAAQVANDQIIATYDDPRALDELARVADLITYEFENVPVAAAEQLAVRGRSSRRRRRWKSRQDRLVEKRFINGCGIAHRRIHPVGSQADLEAAFGLRGSRVLKTRRLGYDRQGPARLPFRCRRSGRRLCRARTGPADPRSFVPVRPGDLGHRARRAPTARPPVSILPKMCIATAFSTHRPCPHPPAGRPRGRPPGGNRHSRRARLCRASSVSSSSFWPTAASSQTRSSPRVHNSGHWTEAACVVSQFRAAYPRDCRPALGRPVAPFGLRDAEPSSATTSPAFRTCLPNAMCSFTLRKAEARSGRKMGTSPLL